MARILLIEDDIEFGETVKDYFEDNGLSVMWAKNGETATGRILSVACRPVYTVCMLRLSEKSR